MAGAFIRPRGHKEDMSKVTTVLEDNLVTMSSKEIAKLTGNLWGMFIMTSATCRRR